MNFTLSRFSLLTVFSSFSFVPLAASAPIACETFGDDPANDLGYTVQPAVFDDLAYDFFGVLPNNGTRFAPITGGTGTNVFAAEDIDSPPSGTTPSSLGQVTTLGVDLTGYTNTQVEIHLAAPGDSNSGLTAFDNPAEYDYGNSENERDLMIVEYSADGVNFSEVVRFEPPVGGFASTVTRTDNFSGVTVNPAIGTAAFSVTSFAIAPGANSQVRVRLQTNGSGEFFAVDSICFTGDVAATEPPVISGLAVAPLDYTEGDGAQLLAPLIALTDSDSSSLDTVTVSLTSGFQAAEDSLTASPSGGIAAGDIVLSGNTLTISGPASPADFTAVLQSLTYTNSETTNPSTETRQVTFTAYDELNNSAAAIRSVEVTNLIDLVSVPFSESFETDGQGERYFAVGEFGAPTDLDLFGRTQPSLTGLDGTYAFAVEDVNTDSNSELEAIYFNVSTVGSLNPKLSFLAAAPGGTSYDSGDFIEAQVSADGLSWIPVGAFHATSDGTAASVGGVTLSQDVDLDGLGDLDSTVLDGTLQDFEFDLPLEGVFQLRIVMQSNVNNERLLLDNVRVSAESVEYEIAAASASEAAGKIDFTLTRNSDVGEVTVEFATADNTATSSDYTAVVAGVATFADGELTTTASVTIANDSTVELDETFTVTLANPSAGVVSETAGAATGTIQNDDSATLNLVASNSVTESDTGSVNLGFTATLSNPSDADVSFELATSLTGSATVGTDFLAKSESLVITAGQTVAQFSVSVLGDNEVEPTETVGAALSLTTAAGRSITAGTSTASGFILDDDPAIDVANSGLGFKAGLSSKILLSDLLLASSGGDGRPFSIASVSQPLGGGEVEIVGDWLIFRAGLTQNTNTSFTYQVTDGVQTVNGLVHVFLEDNGTAQTSNIMTMVSDGSTATITAAGIPGRSYQLEISEDLNLWLPMGAAVVCPGSGVMTLTDEGPLPSSRLYRVVDPSNSNSTIQ